MYHFGQAGAEKVENVRFGEHPAGGPDRQTTKIRFGGSWNSRAFIGIIGATCVISGGKVGCNGQPDEQQYIYKYI